MVPATGIGKFNVSTCPVGTLLRTPHIGGDRSNYGDHDFRAKSFQYPGQTNFAIQAGFQALVSGQVVNGTAAQVDEITTQRAEEFQELTLALRGENAGKGVANGPVKSRVCLIEKSTGGRRPLADEEHPDISRAIPSSQTFPGLQG
jgi:hypothetical protein